MAVSKTTRLGVTRWTDDNDPWDRDDFDDDNAALENLAAIDLQVADLASRPAAGVRGRYCWVGSEERVYRDNGTAWFPVQGKFATGVPTTVAAALGTPLGSIRLDRVGLFSTLLISFTSSGTLGAVQAASIPAPFRPAIDWRGTIIVGGAASPAFLTAAGSLTLGTNLVNGTVVAGSLVYPASTP